MSVKNLTITDFSAGMQPSQRSVDPGAASLIKNFDIAIDNQRLVPVTSVEKWTTGEEERLGIVNIGGPSQGSKIVYGVGKALQGWFSKNWTKRIRFSARGNTAGSADFGFLDLSLLSTEFWDTVKSDGGDIRVTDTSDNSISYYLQSFDKDKKQGRLLFKGTSAFNEKYLYFGNSSAVDAGDLNDIWVSGLDRAYPLDGDNLDYVGIYDLENGASYEAGDFSYLTSGHTGGQMFTESGGGNAGDRCAISLLVNIINLPDLNQELVSDDFNTAEVILTTAGEIRFGVDTVGGGYDIVTSSTNIADGQWHYVVCVYDDSAGVASIYIDGVLDTETTAPSGDLDHDGAARLYVQAPNPNNSAVEMVTIHYGGTKDSGRIFTENSMLLSPQNFWEISDVETVEALNEQYSGVQIYQKTLGQNSWEEFTLNNLPVKSFDYSPTPSFILSSGGSIFTIVNQGGDVDSGLTGLVRLSQLSFTSQDWGGDVLVPTNEAYPRFAFAVDKVNYILDGSNISKISGTTFTADAFVPYSTPNHLTPFGQYLAVASDIGYRSYCQIWDLDSTTNREFIDFGSGRIRVVGSVHGQLFGVVNAALDDEILANGRQAFEVLSWQGGGYAKPFLSFESPLNLETDDSTDIEQPVLNQVEYIKNGMVFYAKLYNDRNELCEGLWAITKNEKNGRFAMSMYLDTSSVGNVQQIYRTGNVLFMTDGNGGVYKTSSDSYATESVWQSVWLPGTDIKIQDQIKSVELNFEPLEDGQIIYLDYRLPDTDWINIFTHNVAGSEDREAKIVESNKGQMPSFNEIQLRIRSKGGRSAITSLSVKIEDRMDK